MKKMRPFSDLTNSFNLIPLSTLRELCESTNPRSNYGSSSSVKSFNLRNNLSGGGFQAKIASDDVAISTSANSSSSTKSDYTSSIGSTGFSHNAITPPSDVFTTPSRRAPPPPTPPPLGSNGSHAVYSRRQSDLEAKRAQEVLSVPLSSCTVEKMKGKGKAVTMPASCPTTIGETGNGNKENAAPFMATSSSPLQKAMGKGKAIVEPSSYPIPGKSVKEKGNAIVAKPILFRLSSPPARTEDRRKSAANPILIRPSFLPAETEDRKKSVTKTSSSLTSNGTEQTKKKEMAAFSCPPLPKTKNKCKRDKNAEAEHSRSRTDPNHKQRKRRCTRQEADPEFALPREFVEQQRSYFKEIDEFELLEEEVSDNELDR